MLHVYAYRFMYINTPYIACSDNLFGFFSILFQVLFRHHNSNQFCSRFHYHCHRVTPDAKTQGDVLIGMLRV